MDQRRPRGRELSEGDLGKGLKVLYGKLQAYVRGQVNAEVVGTLTNTGTCAIGVICILVPLLPMLHRSTPGIGNSLANDR